MFPPLPKRSSEHTKLIHLSSYFKLIYFPASLHKSIHTFISKYLSLQFPQHVPHTNISQNTLQYTHPEQPTIMVLPINPTGLPATTFGNLFNLTFNCVEYASSMAIIGSQYPSHQCGNLLLDRALIILSYIAIGLLVVMAVGLLIVVPCGLILLGVTLAFRYFVEKRLREGDSWFLEEFSGARYGGGRMGLYGNEKRLPGILVEYYD